MGINGKALAAGLGVPAFVLLFASTCNAACGSLGRPALKGTNWPFEPDRVSLLRVSLPQEDDRYDAAGQAAIVGMWHVKFTSQGSTGIPDGTVVDAGYSVWHSDGTEILNSGLRSPSSGDFCLGVWKQVGERQFKLNHLTTAWDPTGTTFVGPGNIREDVIIDRKGTRFKGSFTIDQYDEKGNLLVHIQGIITAERVTIDTVPDHGLF